MFTILTLTLLATASLTAAWNATAGCNSAGFDLDSSGKINRTLPSGRQYLLHVPSDYDASIGHPAVLSFHRAGGTSANQEKLSQLSTPGLRIAGLPIIAAYPQGADNTDQNRTGVWYSAPYANTSVDDIQFTKDVVADISDNYCINPKRIYASGKSNGGGFTAYMACRQDTTKIFAAFAPVSPALYNGTLAFSGCNPARPIPIVTSHGVEGQTIPFDGRNDSSGAYGVGTATINVPLWREQWAVRNGCSETSNGSYLSPTNITSAYVNTTEYIWSCDAEIQAYTVSNLGHSWPTTQGLDSSGAPNNTATFNFTDPPLVGFFSKQTLPDWCFEDQ